MPLPAGFVLDQQQQPQQAAIGVPQGFVLDQAPAAAEPSLGSEFIDYSQPIVPETPGVMDAAAGLLQNPVGDALFNTQSGIVPETARVAATSAKDLTNAVVNLAGLPTQLLAQSMGFEVGQAPQIPDFKDMGNGMEALEPKTALGQFATPMTQYVGGRKVIDMATGPAQSVAGDVGRGAATDFAAFSPDDTRASDIIMKEAANPTDGFWNGLAQNVAKTGVPQWLARGENDGSTGTGNAISRGQNVGEGMLIEAATRLALKGTRVVGGALLSPFFKGVGDAAQRERKMAEDWAAKSKKPVEDLTIQDVAELARRGDIPANNVLKHPEVQRMMTDQVKTFMNAGTINPNSPEFISQLDELTQRVTGNAARTASPATSGLLAADRDAVVRTLYGEARGEGDEGIQAAANVIFNRVESRQKSAGEVVREPKQFSAWDDPRTRPDMDALSPDSEDYKRIGEIVDKIARGELPDNTGGATHYISFDGQKANGDEVPNWAKGTPLKKVGNHTFFSPDSDPVVRKGGTIAVTPDGTAIKGGLDEGAAAGMDAQAAAGAELDGRMAEAAKADPLIAEILNTPGLSPATKRSVFERFESRSAPVNDDPILASRDGAQVKANVNDPGTAAGIEAQRTAEADRLAEMLAAAKTNPAVQAIVDSGVDDAAKLRTYDGMAKAGKIIPAAETPALAQGPKAAAAPFKDFDPSVPRADQDAIVANAQRLEAEAKPKEAIPDVIRPAKPDANDVAGRPAAQNGNAEPPVVRTGRDAPADGAAKGGGPERVSPADKPNEPAERRSAGGNTPEQPSVSKQALTEPAKDKKQGFTDSRTRLREAAATKKTSDEALDEWTSKESDAPGKRLAASTHAPTKAAGEGIQDVAAELQALRQDAAGEAVPKQMDISDTIETVSSAIENARAEKLSPAKGLALVKGDKAAEAVYRLMHNKNLTKLASRDEIANRLGRYIDDAARAGDEATPEEILERIAAAPDDVRSQGSLFDTLDDGSPNRQAIKEPKTKAELADNIEALGGKHELKICGI